MIAEATRKWQASDARSAGGSLWREAKTQIRSSLLPGTMAARLAITRVGNEGFVVIDRPGEPRRGKNV